MSESAEERGVKRLRVYEVLIEWRPKRARDREGCEEEEKGKEV